MSSLIESLFDARWDALGREHVESFLRAAGDEGLTWEVKGDKRECRWPRREQIEKAVCGFANAHRGGVLIIGAERLDEGTGWALAGLSAPAEDDVSMALSKTIETGVQPVPPYRVCSWEVGAGRWGAVVWVEPTPEPPCITRDGLVFLRLTGRTEPVRDAAVLERLFERGLRARARAERAAVEAAGRTHSETHAFIDFASGAQPDAGPHDRFLLGFAAAGYEGDIGGRLVGQTFRKTIEACARSHLRAERVQVDDYPGPRVSVRQARGCVMAQLHPYFNAERGHRWGVRANWDGSVGVGCARPSGPSLELLRDDVLIPAWSVAVELVLALGGVGSAHLASFGTGALDGSRQWPSDKDPIRRWVGLPAPGETDIAPSPVDVDYVLDEIRRQAGQEIWVDDDGRE